MDGTQQDGLYVASNVEDDLADTLTRTAREIDYAECFDQEQRAEVYAILRALREDTQVHRTLAADMARQFVGEAGDAEQAMLRETFEALLEKEQQAEEMYASLIARLTDPAMRQQVEQIQREKRRHIELTRRLLEIVE